MRKYLGFAAIVACLSVGCVANDSDGKQDEEVGQEDETPCDQAAKPLCLGDQGDGLCSDVSVLAVCAESGWQCPAGTLEESSCICLGPPPALGCTCGESGFVCPSACDDSSRPVCLEDRGNGECSDVSVAAECVDAGWQCPADTIVASACVCSGPPPGLGCTCGTEGWLCPCN
jgi:hypothetical protein